MANRNFTPVLFGLEKNLVLLGAHITFGANGAPTLDAINSKGFLSVAQFSTSFTATASTTASFTAVSNFTDLYNGMTISGTNIAASSIISAINAGAGTFTSSNASTGVVSAVTATGGYTLSLGALIQNSPRRDTYAKLIDLDIISDLSGLQGGASTQAGTPAAPSWFMIQNNVANGSLANVVLMCGTMNGAGATFKAVQPASGEGIYVRMLLCNSTAG